jgi:hypothetical protein
MWKKKDFDMAEQTQSTGTRKMNAYGLGALGIILVIVGVAIITIPGAPMRGSGLGTIATLAGIVLLAVALVRFRQKPQK